MKRIEINGNHFSDMASFYDEIKIKFCPELDGMGRNLDAFNDVLRGGFGVYAYGAAVKVVWLNAIKSKKEMPEYDTLVEIILEHAHIDFEEN